MIARSVPTLTSEWSETGTVRVVSSTLSCMMTSPPRRRTPRKPCASRMRQTSLPESLRSLTNTDIEVGDVNLGVVALFDLLAARSFEEELHSLL